MKKNLFFVAALFAGSVAFAQTTEVKDHNDLVVTPQAGDWAVGFNANPLFNYVGNMFNGSTGNSFNSAFVNQTPNSSNAIYGKYFKDENTAFRGSLRLMTMSGTSNVQTDTNTAVGSAPEYITDTYKQSGSNIVLGFGIEKRKGHNRLQGYYGGEALITLGGTQAKSTNTYELALDSTNLANGYVNNNRVLSSKGNTSTGLGTTFGFGLRGFIGAEYFFAPKISVSAEYGWGLSLTNTGGNEVITETYGVKDGATTATVYETTTTTGKSSSFGIDTDNLGGAIRLMFHF
jgi:hypothetical protein